MGVVLDDKLTWKSHVKHIHTKISQALGIVYKVRQFLPSKALITLYYSLIYPYLQYCNTVWGSANKTILQPITMLQKRSIRLVSNAAFLAHTDPLFKELGLLKFVDINRLETLKFVYNQLNFSNTLQYTPIANIHNVNTRNRLNLRTPKPKSELSKRFITYRGCIEWNKLPNDIITSPNNIVFKIRAKKHLLSSY